MNILEVSDLNHWEDFLAPYKQAVEELKIKLKGMRSQFELENNHSPIEFVTGRVKPVASILDKANQKTYCARSFSRRNAGYRWSPHDVPICG